MNINTILPQVKQVIDENGIDITVLRDVYENVVGVKTLVQSGVQVITVKGVMDNSSTSSTNNNVYKETSFITNKVTGVLYIAYDPDIQLDINDYFILDGVKYTMGIPVDLLHLHLIYQCNCEGVKLNGF